MAEMDLVKEVARAMKRLGDWTLDGIAECVLADDDSSPSLTEAILAAVDLARVATRLRRDAPAGFAVVPIEPTEAMVRAGRGALKDYIEGLSMEERAKLRPRKTAKSDNAGYYIKPQTKAAVRWRAMVAAAIQATAKHPVEEPADRRVPAEGERGDTSDDPDGFPV